jgi:hypothetical protein
MRARIQGTIGCSGLPSLVSSDATRGSRGCWLMGSDENDDLDRAIMHFAKLIARQRELLARLSRDLTQQDHQQIEWEMKEIEDGLSACQNPFKQEIQSFPMRKGEVECPSCRAWYRRIEIASMKGEPGEYACLLCGQPLERFSGETYVAYRLTVQPIGRSDDPLLPI